MPAALASLGDRARDGRVDVDVPETLPRVDADPALLERAVANIIDNALAWSPPEQRGAGRGRSRRRRRSTCGSSTAARASPRPIASASSNRSNASATARTARASASVSLSRKGFIEAMGGDLYIDDTPGGGTTMVVTMPVET